MAYDALKDDICRANLDLEASGLVAGHGRFTWGATPRRAVESAIALEATPRRALDTLRLNPDTPGIDPALLDKHFLRKHGAGAYYGQR